MKERERGKRERERQILPERETEIQRDKKCNKDIASSVKDK